MNIAFPFVILMSQNDIQRNKLRYLESRNLDHFHSIVNKHITIFDDILHEKTEHAQLGRLEKPVYSDDKSVKYVIRVSCV